MKLNPNADVPSFLLAVQNCTGDVHFTTSEGDNLNLKSAISQFVFAAVVSEQLAALNGEILIQCSGDLPILERYLM